MEIRRTQTEELSAFFNSVRRLDTKAVAAALLADEGRMITAETATRALWTVLGMENLFQGDVFPAKTRVPRVDAIVEALLEAGAEINARCGSYSALHFAACMVPYNAARLIEAGADVNAQTGSGWTALMGAPTSSAKLLLEAGADPNISTMHGWTPMHLCRSTAKAVLLLEHGAALDARDKEGRTPMLHAAGAGCLPMVKWLSHNEDLLSQRDDAGNDVLIAAAGAGKLKIVKILLERGLSPFSQNDAGETALDAAKPHDDILKLLHLQQ